MTDACNFVISSPKRARAENEGWEGFFPYYAGFPAEFAQTLIASADLHPDAIILDPWNGSGTTSYAAAACGRSAIGIDINPVMVIVARARLLASSEADTLVPLGQRVIREARTNRRLEKSDPLLTWFTPAASGALRGIERSIRAHLVGSLTITPKGARLDHLSGLAAVNYVALFSVARHLALKFRTSNPTWLRAPKQGEARTKVSALEIEHMFEEKLRSMREALLTQISDGPSQTATEIRLGDATNAIISNNRVDFVLTSPPYCTRIDYTAATRIELALLKDFLADGVDALRRRMIGSPLSPARQIIAKDRWGDTCVNFLESVKSHPSRASSGYYYHTHLDYFDKMDRSLSRIADAIKVGGNAVFVVQDSYYKEMHNDLPTMISEIAASHRLEIRRREDFSVRTMASINPGSARYRTETKAVESVICLHKI